MVQPMTEDSDWRLQGRVEGLEDPAPVLSLIHRHQHSRLLGDVDAAVSERVVITHDGEQLFAYAPDRDAIEAARTAIEAALAGDGASIRLTLSHWDPGSDEWVDPDAPAAAAPKGSAADSEQTRTLVALVGREIRSEFERSLQIYAQEIGVRCEVSEHPHLLSVQAAFTISGPAHKLDEFAAALAAEERRTIRTEETVMASPL
jgi:hypothetical protein